MFDLSMFPSPAICNQSGLQPVTPVTNAKRLQENPNRNNVVTSVTGKNPKRLQENFNKNNVVTDVTSVTGKNQCNRNAIDPAEFAECFEERAGILEYCAGFPRGEAERQAKVICLDWFRNRKQATR